MRQVDRITIEARDDGRYDIQECHPEAVDSLNVAGQPFAFSSGTVEFGGDNKKYIHITRSRGGFQAVIWFDNMEPENVLSEERMKKEHMRDEVDPDLSWSDVRS